MTPTPAARERTLEEVRADILNRIGRRSPFEDATRADVETVLEAMSRGLTQNLLHGTLAELHASDAGHHGQCRDGDLGRTDVPTRPASVLWRTAGAVSTERL